MNEKHEPAANADGGYLPMPWDGARRIENERIRYREAQRRHHELFPNYVEGWRRPSETTTEHVWALVGDAATSMVGYLSPIEREALVVALDAAVQAGQDGRLLTHNLIFDAVAAARSDHYRAARERGPARVSWEMSEETLKGAWRDLEREEIDLEKLIRAAQDGCGLYKVEQGQDERYTVDLEHCATAKLREGFLAIIADDRASGGTYRRRSSMLRLRLAEDASTDDASANDASPDVELTHELYDLGDLADAPDGADDGDSAEDSTTRKVVAGVAYNVAAPGQRSLEVIRALEGTRLYLNVANLKAENKRLIAAADEEASAAWEKYRVDVTKSTGKAERAVIDAGTLQRRKGHWPSAWEIELRKLKSDRNAVDAAIALAKKYDKFEGQHRQLKAVVDQIEKIEKVGGVDRHGEIKICTRYAKLSNRRFQARDFWFSEISGKDEQSEVYDLGPVSFDEQGAGPSMLERVTTSRRGRLFRMAASRSAEDRGRLRRASEFGGDEYADLLNDRQDLIGVDVSGSQMQIYAVLLGLRDFENTLRTTPYKEIAASRVWARHDDPLDKFCLPDDHDYNRDGDDRLNEAVKKTAMTYLYGSPPARIVKRLAESPDDFGTGLGTISNLRLFLEDRVLYFDQIKRWKKACARIASRAWDADPYAGIVFTDPYDKTPVRWNPVGWKIDRVAGSGGVRIRAKVPLTARGEPAKPDERLGPAGFPGDFPVDRHKTATTFGPCFVHTLDSMFCALVVKELQCRDVSDVVCVHDAFYIAPDAFGKLDAAVKAASRPWFEALGDVYDELGRLLGTCTPPTRGKNKGECCGHCGNWIRKLKAIWQERMNTSEFPEFRVGEQRPTSVDVITETNLKGLK